MVNNNDNSGKGSGKPGQNAPPKKPSAIIDLKATEVGIRDVSKQSRSGTVSDGASGKPGAADSATRSPAEIASAAAAKAAAEAATGASKERAGGGSQGVASGGQTATPTGTASTASTAGGSAGKTSAASAGGSGRDGSGSQSGGRPAAPPPPVRSSGGGIGAAFTHLVAGLAGGVLALLGADSIAPMLGVSLPQRTALPAGLDQRLKALEVSATRPAAAVPAELGAKLADAEQKLGQLADIKRASEALAEQQRKLAAELRAVAARTAASGSDTASTERLTKLEQTLQSLAAAAKSDPNRAGRIPQLAALTGRLGDLESNVTNQIAALRKNVTQEVDSRLAQSTEASETARAGTQRIDRDLAGVKTEQARSLQRLDELKAGDERLAISLKSLRDNAAALKAAIAATSGEISGEVGKALEPVSKRIAGLEQSVASVVSSERDRRSNAQRIVMALELGNLKRTVERGVPFSAELSEVKKLAVAKLDLTALERYQERGVPTTAELTSEFRNLAHTIIDADSQATDASWTDRLLSGAKSIVKVRRVKVNPDDKGTESIVARMESSLKGERLTDVANEAAKLSAKAAAPAKGWLQKVEARATVDRAISRIESELKSSLGAAPQGGNKGG